MRKNLPVIAALLVGAAVALVAVLVVGGGDDEPKTASTKSQAAQERPVIENGKELVGPKDSFKLQYPESWKELKASDIGAEAGVPVAAVRRDKGDALIVVQQRGKLEGSADKVLQDLSSQLKKQFKNDFKYVRSGKLEIPAGNALSYTFIRTKTGQVQNMVVLPEKNRSYTLNSVVAGDAQDAAREVAQIVRTFTPEG